MTVHFNYINKFEPPIVEALNINTKNNYRNYKNSLEDIVVEPLNTRRRNSYRNYSGKNLAPIVIEGLTVKPQRAYKNYKNSLEDIVVESFSDTRLKKTLRDYKNSLEDVVVETLSSGKKRPIYREIFNVLSPEDAGPDALLFPEFITLPVSINREEDNVFLVDKAKLLEQGPIADDAFFSDQNNWKKIILLYKSTTGVYKTISFDLSKANPDGVFNPSLTDPSTWELVGASVYGHNPQDNISLDREYLIRYPYDFVIV